MRFVLYALLCLFIAAPAAAQPEVLYQPDTQMPGEGTHEPIRLTPDKSEILDLDKPAGTIVVGNPAHVNVMADSTTRLILVPRAPGASHFTVLDEDGGLIMSRHIIVDGPKENYVRVRRSCANAGESACMPTSVFYCPDTCHEIQLPIEAVEGGTSSAAAGAAEGAGEVAETAGDLAGEMTDTSY